MIPLLTDLRIIAGAKTLRQTVYFAQDRLQAGHSTCGQNSIQPAKDDIDKITDLELNRVSLWFATEELPGGRRNPPKNGKNSPD